MIICGDSLKVLPGLPENSIDLIVTDPPYKTTSRGSYGGTGGMFKKDIVKSGQVFENNDAEISGWATELYRVLKPGRHCYIMTNDKNLRHYLNSIEDAGFSIFKVLIWDKVSPIVNMYYMSAHEYIIFCRKGKAVRINDCSTKSILRVKNNKLKDSKGNNLHDTEKPVELMRILIENSSNKGYVVLDPFMGIGSTGVACVKTGRGFIGIEIDETYCKIAKDRINTRQLELDL